MPSFHIRVASDDLVFSAGHFITFGDGHCERLHGHTFRVAVEVFGPLNNHSYVADFVAVRATLKEIIAELDHRMLLPTRHPTIRMASQDGEIEATFGKRRWVFPKDDCLLLPIANTTTELFAQYIGELFWKQWTSRHTDTPAKVRIEISEGSGSWAICELP